MVVAVDRLAGALGTTPAFLLGEGRDDSLDGGDNNDFIAANDPSTGGTDTVEGGGGRDGIEPTDGEADAIDRGPGIDTVDFDQESCEN